MRILLGRDGIVLGQFANVGSGNKRLVTRANHDNHADDGIVLDVVKRRPQFFHGCHVERVQHLGTVDGDVSNGISLFEEYVLEVHKFTLVRIAYLGDQRRYCAIRQPSSYSLNNSAALPDDGSGY